MQGGGGAASPAAPMNDAGARPPPAAARAANWLAGSGGPGNGRARSELAAPTAEVKACAVASCVAPVVSLPSGDTAVDGGAEPNRRRGDSCLRTPAGPPRSCSGWPCP